MQPSVWPLLIGVLQLPLLVGSLWFLLRAGWVGLVAGDRCKGFDYISMHFACKGAAWIMHKAFLT